MPHLAPEQALGLALAEARRAMRVILEALGMQAAAPRQRFPVGTHPRVGRMRRGRQILERQILFLGEPLQPFHPRIAFQEHMESRLRVRLRSQVRALREPAQIL